MSYSVRKPFYTSVKFFTKEGEEDTFTEEEKNYVKGEMEKANNLPAFKEAANMCHLNAKGVGTKLEQSDKGVGVIITRGFLYQDQCIGYYADACLIVSKEKLSNDDHFSKYSIELDRDKRYGFHYMIDYEPPEGKDKWRKSPVNSALFNNECGNPTTRYVQYQDDDCALPLLLSESTRKTLIGYEATASYGLDFFGPKRSIKIPSGGKWVHSRCLCQTCKGRGNWFAKEVDEEPREGMALSGRKRKEVQDEASYESSEESGEIHRVKHYNCYNWPSVCRELQQSFDGVIPWESGIQNKGDRANILYMQLKKQESEGIVNLEKSRDVGKGLYGILSVEIPAVNRVEFDKGHVKTIASSRHSKGDSDKMKMYSVYKRIWGNAGFVETIMEDQTIVYRHEDAEPLEQAEDGNASEPDDARERIDRPDFRTLAQTMEAAYVGPLPWKMGAEDKGSKLKVLFMQLTNFAERGIVELEHSIDWNDGFYGINVIRVPRDKRSEFDQGHVKPMCLFRRQLSATRMKTQYGYFLRIWRIAGFEETLEIDNSLVYTFKQEIFDRYKRWIKLYSGL